MNDIQSDFIDEAREKLDELDQILDGLRQGEGDQDLYSKLFRILHTIKGSCAFLGLESLVQLTHHAESILTRLQGGDIKITQDDIDMIITTRDTVTATLHELKSGAPDKPAGEKSLQTIWDRLRMLVDDLSAQLGKEIEVYTQGTQTPLDDAVYNLIKDPLMLMVLNAVDHGIEPPAQRRAAGKPEKAAIALNAFHDDGHLTVTVSDDGQGLNLERIKLKALDHGIVTEEELAGMNEQEIYSLVFRAGFTTAASVTTTSGRGVGLDVVRENIEQGGGHISLNSQEGEGATFIIKIPQN